MILSFDVKIDPYETELKFERLVLSNAFKMKFWGEMERLVERMVKEEFGDDMTELVQVTERREQ